MSIVEGVRLNRRHAQDYDGNVLPVHVSSMRGYANYKSDGHPKAKYRVVAAEYQKELEDMVLGFRLVLNRTEQSYSSISRTNALADPWTMVIEHQRALQKQFDQIWSPVWLEYTSNRHSQSHISDNGVSEGV